MAISHLSDALPDNPDGLVVTITPSRAQAFGVCPYRFAHEKKRFDAANRHLQVGQWVHELTHDYNLVRINGREPMIDDIIARKAPPALFMDAGDDEHWIIDIGSASLRGYRAFLEAQEFSIIIDAERYVRTPTRPVAGVEGCSIVLSGRVDVIAMRDDRSIACIDVKTGMVPTPTQLAEAPGSFIYHHLTQYIYGADEVDIVQVNPITGQWASARPTKSQIEAGKDFCRAMAAAIKEQSYPPHPGDACSYCVLAERICPAHQVQKAGWDTAF